MFLVIQDIAHLQGAKAQLHGVIITRTDGHEDSGYSGKSGRESAWAIVIERNKVHETTRSPCRVAWIARSANDLKPTIGKTLHCAQPRMGHKGRE
jgi:hypothetical protein